jgi:hypothetical protein
VFDVGNRLILWPNFVAWGFDWLQISSVLCCANEANEATKKLYDEGILL